MKRIEAGCDEVGRGCLAGPVTAAAVILPPQFRHPLLRDSKLLTAKQRYELKQIIEAKAIAWSVAFLSNTDVDYYNILRASVIAMSKAAEELAVSPDFLLIDGNRFDPQSPIPYQCVVGGDNKFKPIAAASILAKCHRDAYMATLHSKYPHYNWEKNKGYATREHREQIAIAGPSPYHRLTFRLLPDMSQMAMFGKSAN